MNALRLLSLSLLLLFGCSDVSVPLGPPETAPMMQELVGTWEVIEIPEDEGRGAMQLIQFNDHEYYIEFSHFEKDSTIPEIMRLRAFITPVDEHLFANVQAIEEEIDDRDYMIFWFDLANNDIISTVMIDEDMSHIKTSEELITFVKDLIANDYLETDEVMSFKKLPRDSE